MNTASKVTSAENLTFGGEEIRLLTAYKGVEYERILLYSNPAWDAPNPTDMHHRSNPV